MGPSSPVVVGKGEQLRGSGDDSRTCFYQLAQHAELIHPNAFGERFEGSGHEEWGGRPGCWYHTALRVVAMGDLNAADVAQAVHAQIFTESLEKGDLLVECGEPLPARDLLPGVYIDDTLVAWL